MKFLNSSLMKLAALFETRNSGSPCCAKISLSLFNVAVDVVEPVQRSQCGCEITVFSGHSEGCSGVAGGDLLCN